MKPRLERVLAQSIRQNRMLGAGDRVGVAVSGGADSVALLRLLDALRDDLGISLIVVHFDHCLRPESRDDAKFVEELAESRGFAFVGGEDEVAKAAAANKWNLEDAARRLRYAFFTRVVNEGRATRIAVAHTMDDQAETVLARMLRGTGPSGLAGIYPSTGVIVRPLLGVRREELRDFLRGLKQSWREDATNDDLDRQRAKIRKQLLPVIKRDFAPQAVERLANLARFSREEGIFWRALVENRFAELVTRSERGLSISIAKLRAPLVFTASSPCSDETQTQRVLTERLIRRLYEELRGDLQALTAAHVDQVLWLAEGASSGKHVELPAYVRVARNFGELLFFRAVPGRKSGREAGAEDRSYRYEVILKRDTTTDVSVPELGTCFRLKMIDWSWAERETTSWTSLLDADRLREPLILRNWHPGDAYCPRGRRNPRKIKEMFVAARIAAGEREGWPVLESDGQVVWAKGLAAAAAFGVGAGTKAGVLIEEHKF